MANVRQGNTFYIDTQYSAAADELAEKNIIVMGVLVTATAASAVLVLKDGQSTAVTKMDLRVATSGASQLFDFSSIGGIPFSTSIRPTTLTNAVATVITKTTGV